MKSDPDPGASVSVAVKTLLPGRAMTITNIAVPTGRVRTVDLIRAKAKSDWSRVEARRDMPGDTARPPEWHTGAGGAPSTLEEAVHASVDAFRAGWYNILVDGSEPGGLDAWIMLDERSTVAFVWAAPPPDLPSPQILVEPTLGPPADEPREEC